MDNDLVFEVEISPYTTLPSSKSEPFLSDSLESVITEMLSDNGIDADVRVKLIE